MILRTFDMRIYNSVFCVLVVLMNSLLAHSAALSQPLILPAISQSLNQSSPQNFTSPNLSRPQKCTAKDDWFSPRFVEDDCRNALLFLWATELQTGSPYRQEFLARGAKKTTRYKAQQTPRKYIYSNYVFMRIVFPPTLNFPIDTCTLAIVMTNSFRIGDLPGGYGKGSPTDVATWQDVWETAEFVYQQCVENEDLAGWESTGE